MQLKTPVFDNKLLSDPSGLWCHVGCQMHCVTCLKVKNSEFWSISDPNGFRKTFVDCTANPILLMRKLRLGNQVPSLRWHDWEVETPYETTKVVGVNPWLYNPWVLLTLPWSMGWSPGPKLRALGPRPMNSMTSIHSYSDGNMFFSAFWLL